MLEPSSQPLRFDTFELDESNARLTLQGRPIALPPKAFAVLCALTRQAGRLITKDALLDAVWGHRHVSESVLKTTISQVRSALSDDATQPRYIETVSRRGYRFAGTLKSAAGAEPTVLGNPGAGAASAPPLLLREGVPQEALAIEVARPAMIGRQTALAKLEAAWQRVNAGARELVWIAGDAGIGKTTLIEGFANRLGSAVVARGQCVEQVGAGEPYLPVLEALGTLCRRFAELPAMLRAIAPTWLLQLPWLSGEAERQALQRELAGTNQDRMVREILELLSRFTQPVPLIILTEDLHWADHGTLRLMDHFARMRTAARVLWVGSLRLNQVIAEGHPLMALRQELRLHRLCSEVMLEPFSAAEVSDYVASRVPGAAIPESLVQRLHSHTDGLPLFVANVIETLKERQDDSNESWLQASLRADLPIPESLTGAIERQIARLADELQTLLQIASVCGAEFRSQIVGAVIGRDAQWVEERCDELLRRQSWIRHVSLSELPDGSLDTRYAFRHALYRSVFYQRLAPAARVQIHRRVALAMERSQVSAGPVAPAELAAQYEAGLVHATALRYYVEAARSALGHFAPQEAVDLTARALTLLSRCPEGIERSELELALLSHRGIAASQLHGMAGPEVQVTFDRVQVLCDSLPEAPGRAFVLNGLAWVYFGRGDYENARVLAERVEQLSIRYQDPVLHVCACNLLGTVFTMRAEYAESRKWLESGLMTCEQLGERAPDAVFIIDPNIIMRATLAVPMLHLGYPEQAEALMQDAVQRATAMGQPMARMIVTWNMAMLYMRLRTPQEVAPLAATLDDIVTRFGLPNGEGPALWIRGWVEAQLGAPLSGYQRILQGHAHHRHMGVFARADSHAYAAEALLLAGNWAGAHEHLGQALDIVQRFGERMLLPDFMMLQARCLVAERRIDAARRSLQEALAEARARHSVWHELRVLTALCELEGVSGADLAELSAVVARFTEGHQTSSYCQAREFIARGANSGVRSCSPADT